MCTQTSENLCLVTWPEAVGRRVLGRAWFAFWPLVSLLVFLGQLALVIVLKGSIAGLPVFGLYLALMAILAVLTPFFGTKLEQLRRALPQFVLDEPAALDFWFRSRLKRMFRLRSDLWVFLILAPPAVVTLIVATSFFRRMEPWFGNAYSNYYALAAFCLFVFFCCHHLRLVFEVAGLVQEVSSRRLKVSTYLHPFSGVKSLGSLLFAMSFSYAVCALFLYVGIYISPLPATLLTIPWMLACAAVLLWFFIYPQYRVHRVLVCAKHEEISKMASHVDSAMRAMIDDPSMANIALFESQYGVNAKLAEGMYEWPFDKSKLVSLIVTLVLPVLGEVLKQFLP